MREITVVLKFTVQEMGDRPLEEILQAFEEPVNHMQLAAARSTPVAWICERDGFMVDYEINGAETESLFKLFFPYVFKRIVNFLRRYEL